jgi:hypothetical protein
MIDSVRFKLLYGPYSPKTCRVGVMDGRIQWPYAQATRPHGSVVCGSLITELATARELGSDIIDMQDFAGNADPRTTLTYIRTRDQLSKSPAYVLPYS